MNGSKLVYNVASINGGGICVSISTSVYVFSSVIAYNQATGYSSTNSGGGGVATLSASATLSLIETLLLSNVGKRT